MPPETHAHTHLILEQPLATYNYLSGSRMIVKNLIVDFQYGTYEMRLEYDIGSFILGGVWVLI